jgi:hypothetical protein
VCGVDVVMLVLCFLVSKPLFCRMAATPFEFKKKNAAKEKKNKHSRPFLSALRKEWITGLRSNYFLKLAAILIAIMPMAIYLLSSIYSSMKLTSFGHQMTVCFTIMIMLLILLMTNIDIASVYSRDGASSYLNKIQPASYVTLLISKLIFPMIIALVGVIITVNIFAIESGLATENAILIGILVYGIYVAHLFSSAERDIMNPQYKQYATFSAQTNNPNESGAGISAIIMSAVVFVIALFLSSRPDHDVWIKLAAVSVVFALFKIFTYVSKIKAFYKEKQ